MGRSGSGKSTLLRILGLLDMPSGGEVKIDGVDALKLAEKDRARFRLKKLGYVFQEHSLIAELNVLENVYLPAVADLADTNYRKRAKEILDLVGLKDRLRHYPAEISGGEQQRVAIARALVNQPRTLFADEPTASLDMDSSRVVLDLFHKLNRDLGQTIVMVTHEPEDRQYVDRVIWMKDGRIDNG
jgi:putative ABC transport system ATP-binding protein